MSGIIAQNSGRHTGLVKSASAAGVWNLIETFTSDGSDADPYDLIVFPEKSSHC